MVLYFGPGSVLSGRTRATLNGNPAPGTVGPSLSTPTNGST